MQADKPKKDASAVLAGHNTISLESYKKSGEPKQTPVWFIFENGLIYFKTSPKSWKAKRLRRNSSVRVAPSTFSGKILGDWLKGTASLVEGDTKRINKAINSKQGIQGRIISLVEGERVVYSIKIDSSST